MSSYVIQVNLKPVILLPQLPVSHDYRKVPHFDTWGSSVVRREPLHLNSLRRMMSFIFKLIQKPEQLSISLLYSS